MPCFKDLKSKFCVNAVMSYSSKLAGLQNGFKSHYL